MNASKIARETVKLSITNTAMIGEFLRVAEVVEMDSVVEQLKSDLERALGLTSRL